jgi:hypothetical protein
VSLIDLAYREPVDVWLVFRSLPAEAKQSRWWKLLMPGFDHVEVWKNTKSVWIRIEPCLEYLAPEVHEQPPWELVLPELDPTFLRVQRTVDKGTWREPWHFGPITCVELTKAVLGIRAPFVRTPWQLYKRMKRCS